MNSADTIGMPASRDSVAKPALPGIGGAGEKRGIVSSYHEQLNRFWQRSSHTRITVSGAGTRLSIGCKPSVNWEREESFNTTTIQYVRIKSWMSEIIPGHGGIPGSRKHTSGGSALISAALGRHRDSSMNFSDVLVDGGGRVVRKARIRN